MPGAAAVRDELVVVLDRRNKEATEAGLSPAEAWIFANDTSDIGVLRKLVKDGCPPTLIARIVL